MKQHFTVYGSGEAIVLLHGSMASKEQWSSLARQLSKNYRVITIDLLGYGRSPLPDNLKKYDMKQESSHISETLIEVGDVTQYHLLGHSYGGAVALYHAYIHRPQVTSLTVYEPMSYNLLENGHPLLEESHRMAADIVKDIESGNSVVGAKKFIDLWLPEGTFDRTTEMEKAFLAAGVKMMVHNFRSATTTPCSPEDYQALDIPTCLLAGKLSPVFSLSIADVVAACLPDIEVHRVEGGHVGLFSHPYSTNPIIFDFLKRQKQLDCQPM